MGSGRNKDAVDQFRAAVRQHTRSKVGEETIRLWSAVMAAVPDSRLLLKSISIADPSTRRRVLERIAAGGIDPGRIEALGYTEKPADHLALYSRIHVALDSTPYNGTTTTCEAMWMGVPVVVLEGDRHGARVGMSLLRAAGRAEWVAHTSSEFVAIAAGLAQDHARHCDWRTNARAVLRDSTLLDTSGGFPSGQEAALKANYPDGWDQSGWLRTPKGHIEKYPWCKFKRTISVEVRTLDTWASKHAPGKIDFIWADMQGAEGDLATDGAQTLSRTRFLYCEYSNEELYEGEPSLAKLLELMPTFDVVYRLPCDVLLRNTAFVGTA